MANRNPQQCIEKFAKKSGSGMTKSGSSSPSSPIASTVNILINQRTRIPIAHNSIKSFSGLKVTAKTPFPAVTKSIRQVLRLQSLNDGVISRLPNTSPSLAWPRTPSGAIEGYRQTLLSSLAAIDRNVGIRPQRRSILGNSSGPLMLI